MHVFIVMNGTVDSDDGSGDGDTGGGIRRACSLSDLANPAPRRAPVQGEFFSPLLLTSTHI